LSGRKRSQCQQKTDQHKDRIFPHDFHLCNVGAVSLPNKAQTGQMSRHLAESTSSFGIIQDIASCFFLYCQIDKEEFTLSQ
jgi:hypothetical protein